jgi:hypothetical protein
MLGAHLFLGVPAVMLYMAWALAIDGPHVFATLSRTYLDPEERIARARLLRWSLAFFALGPASVALAAFIGTRTPFDVFLVFCSLWAYWHVVRQHYGVMVLYERKAGDADRGDGIVLHLALLAPFVAFILVHPRTLQLLGFEAAPAWAAAGSSAAWALFAAALATLVARQLLRARAGPPVNRAKLLFLTAAVSVSAVLFSSPVAARIGTRPCPRSSPRSTTCSTWHSSGSSSGTACGRAARAGARSSSAASGDSSPRGSPSPSGTACCSAASSAPGPDATSAPRRCRSRPGSR